MASKFGSEDYMDLPGNTEDDSFPSDTSVPGMFSPGDCISHPPINQFEQPENYDD